MQPTSPTYRILITRLLAVAILTVCCLAASAKKTSAGYHFKPVNPYFDSVAARVLDDEFNRRHTPETAANIEKLQKTAQKGNPVMKARAALLGIRANQLGAASDSCISILEKIKSAVPKEYDYDHAVLAYQLAGNHERIGNYLNTYQLLQEAIPVFEKYGDDYFLGNAHLLMGLMYSSIRDPELAVEEIQAADRHYRKSGYPVNRVYFFEASLDPDENRQLRLLKKSIATGGDDPGMTIQAYDNIATIFNRRNQPDSALHYIRQGNAMLERMIPGNKTLKILLDLKEAQTRLSIGQTDSALAIARKAETANSAFRDEYWEPSIYKLLSLIYEIKGNKELAFRYLKRYQEGFERNAETIQAQEIPKARAREAINRQKTQIAEMEQENRNARNRFYIILLILGIVLLGAGASIYFFIQRIKMRKIENRELRTNLECEMVIKRLNMENFERDMKKKDCEISSSVLLLSNKNDVLTQIGEITKRYYDEGKVPPEYVAQVNSLVSDSIKGDDEWTRFKVHFDSVHPDFFTKLKNLSAELTENDLRLCAYLRIGMRAKDIASMLSVSPASVNTNRYRIRKKLGLGKEDSLDDYIRRI